MGLTVVASPKVMPTLAYCDVDGTDRTMELGAVPISVGRSADCTIRSEDQRCSRQHARFTLEGGYAWVEDLGSANGVWVGPQRVSKAPVPVGELVVIGSMLFRVVDPRFAPQAQPGTHAQLSEWLIMERKNRGNAGAERDALALRLSSIHQEIETAREEARAARQRAAEAEAAVREAGSRSDGEARAATAERRVLELEARAAAASASEREAEARAEEAEDKLRAAERRARDAEERVSTAESSARAAAAGAGAAGADAARVAELEGELARVRRRLEETDTELDELDRLKVKHGQTEQKIATLERELAEARRAPASAPAAAARLPAGLTDQLSALGDAISSLRASLRAVSDETAVMDQSDSVQVVVSAVATATEDIERARDALRALNTLAGN